MLRQGMRVEREEDDGIVELPFSVLLLSADHFAGVKGHDDFVPDLIFFRR
jgi:hypothetical protein